MHVGSLRLPEFIYASSFPLAKGLPLQWCQVANWFFQVIKRDSVAVGMNGSNRHTGFMVVMQMNGVVEEAQRISVFVNASSIFFVWRLSGQSHSTETTRTALEPDILLPDCSPLQRLQSSVVYRQIHAVRSFGCSNTPYPTESKYVQRNRCA